MTAPSQLSTPAPRILVVDDDPDVLTVVRHTLELAGFRVITTDRGPKVLRWIEEHGLPHLALVDLMMPEMDGFTLCREIHRFADLPIIVLTAVDDPATVVEALETMADDYLVKPFNPPELVARIRRVLGRYPDLKAAAGEPVKVDQRLQVDLARMRAKVDGEDVVLTPTENKILHVLMNAPQRTVSHGILLERVWPLEEVFEDTLRVHVYRLRKKIEPDPAKPRYLVTRRGIGYAFSPQNGEGLQEAEPAPS